MEAEVDPFLGALASRHWGGPALPTAAPYRTRVRGPLISWRCAAGCLDSLPTQQLFYPLS